MVRHAEELGSCGGWLCNEVYERGMETGSVTGFGAWTEDDKKHLLVVWGVEPHVSQPGLWLTRASCR